jgi:hypothetical protein
MDGVFPVTEAVLVFLIVELAFDAAHSLGRFEIVSGGL